jgi:hypothetical protein
MKTPAALLLVLLAVLVAACDRSAAREPVPAGGTATLAPGETVAFAVDAREVRVTFAGVTGDSRCPIDVVCIQMGDATVRLLVSGESAEIAFPRITDATVGGVVLTVTDLRPAPRAGIAIAAGDYRVTLAVSAAP